ncbi:MAG: DUF2510 domain-containing protein [Ilumatobacter sp.]|nr:DUF2510 domain-containing protein [Ilumatobacter sp.]
MPDLSGFEPPSGPPAGWYPDPYNPAQQRYWDGRAWDLSTPVVGFAPGDTDAYPDVGDWLDVSFRSAYRRWAASALIAVVTAPITSVASYVAIDRLASGLVITDDGVDGWTSGRLPGVILLFVLGSLASAIGGLGLTRLMLDTVDGEEPGSITSELAAGARALGRGLAALPRAIGWFALLMAAFVAAGLILVVIGALIPVLGVLIILAAIPVFVWLGITWSFAVVAVVDGPGNPFTRSAETVRGRWWSTFGRLLLLGIIMWLVSLIIQTVGTVVSGGGFGSFGSGGGTTIEIDSNGNFDPIVLDDELDFGAWFITVSAVTSVLGTILASSVTAAALSVLYRTRILRRP